MKHRCEREANGWQALTSLFITGALMGACEKPAMHGSTPESEPVVTTAHAVDATARDHAATTTPASTAMAGSTADQTPVVPGSNAPAIPPSATALLGTSTVQGCLSKPLSAQNAPTRAPQKAMPAAFRVTPLGNGALATHTFGHACCLSATTETQLEATTVTIRERLTGTPCRCVCDSTIKTRLNLKAGEYDVRLVLDTNGVETEVGRTPLVVKNVIDR